VTRVRAVDDRDFDAIAALTNEYIANTPIHFGYEKVTGAELRDAWWPKHATYPYLVAVDEDDRFLGYAKAGAWRERAAYQWTAEVGIYVAANSHRRGVGRTLYAELIAQCKVRGFHTLVGGITLPNEASVRLHEALGFVKVAHFQCVGWKLGRWHDVGFWQLVLAPATESPVTLH
jgi:phosphinothricin acetyltransferase